jgi:serine/threonine protein kinase/tetratricopeptide (TPR) repeat protein
VSGSTFPSQPAPSEGRYETLRTLGQGGTGTVYLARDRETGATIALKKLLRMDPKSVLRVKREFRSLADMHHRNLVELYDLGVGSDGWFLTMEYVEGADLLKHLGCSPHESGDRDISSTRDIGRAGARKVTVRDLDATINAFHQLASGIRALHQAGMLHRDLKPSNVLVASGRVVVLDFGLVRGLDSQDVVLTQDGLISGTPAYMAPEQANVEKPLGEAADWYALGVMLYQVLSGELPIEGRTAVELILRKTANDPLPIERLVSHLPAELNDLCNRLLQREPERRPSGDDVLRVLEGLMNGQPATDTSRLTFDLSLTTQTVSRGKAALSVVGRSSELQQLEAALDEAREGVAVVAHVRGASGAGKSTLVEQFLSHLEDDTGRLGSTEPLVLRSRCNEREAMPYKALDGVMDSLVQYLLELNDFDLGRLLPVDVAELAQLFPVMQRVPSVRRLLEATKSRGDVLQTRMRAEAALRELFSRLAMRRTLVLWIDDLQWGDLDSTNILKSWREQLATSSMLLVFSYRTDEVETSPCLRALLDRAPQSRNQAREQIIDITALEQDDVRELCERRLGSVALERPDLIGRIAGESQGNPFLVSQLAALVQAKLAHGDQDLETLSIEQLVDQATELLSPDATRTLKTLAIAGRPLSPKVALQAANVRSEGRALLHALRGLRLIRVRDTGTSQLIEVYHDRVREGVLGSLEAPERQRIHADLLAALEDQPDGDAGWLHTLALGAAQPSAALRYGLLAADRAEAALAFERAAELYQHCIELSDSMGQDGSGLRVRRAEALARTGHGGRAADAYLEAAKGVERGDSVRYMRLAASHLLRCGEFERGDAIVREVLSALDLRIPDTDAGVIAALIWERTALAVRGLEFRRNDVPLPAEVAEAIDLYGRLAVEYQTHDPLRAALFQSRGFRAALAAGEPERVARALCTTAIVACVNGSERAARESDGLLARAEALSAELDIDSLRADILASRAICAFMLGRPERILEYSYAAERIYRADGRADSSGDYYYRFVVVAVRIGTLINLGQNERALAELASSLEEARATNNQNALLQLTVCQTYADGLHDRIENSKARLLEERKRLPQGRFGPLHTLHMIAVMRTACGGHDYSWAEPWLEDAWQQWKRSPARLSAFTSMVALGARLRYLVNRHVIERRTEDLEAVVRADLKAARSVPFEDWRVGLLARTHARLDYLAGRRGSAIENLKTVIEVLERAGAAAEASRDRYALGFLIGGTEGASLRAEADRQLREQLTVDPLAELHANYPELLGESFGS